MSHSFLPNCDLTQSIHQTVLQIQRLDERISNLENHINFLQQQLNFVYSNLNIDSLCDAFDRCTVMETH